MDKKALHELANQLACPEGEKGIELGQMMNRQNAFLVEHVIERLAPVNGEHILELGPGNGVLSVPVIHAIGKEGRFTGIEKSKVMAEQAREIFSREGFENAEIIVDDIQCVSVDENTLDGVLIINVLYFIDNISDLLGYIYARLRPGGRLVIGLRSPESLRTMPFTVFKFREVSMDEIKKALYQAEFVEIETEYYEEGKTVIAGYEIMLDSMVIKATRK